ncbi:NUDIX domain-containing protein [Microbacterium sp. 22179]|uniref:NUDIX domain-containing protein n=1 Tax=Microbacterium sp. 22179 TaxID=3453886 RepID=UPI003F87585B
MISDYVRAMRDRIGHDLLMLPGVTAVIRDGERFLLARSAGTDEWSLIGGGVEPGEEPTDAVVREVREELGAGIRITGIVGAYGGESLVVEYPNGDRVAYVTTAYACEVVDKIEPDGEEIVEVGWFTASEIAGLDREPWIDRVLADAVARVH